MHQKYCRRRKSRPGEYIAIDDVGIGYANIASLQHGPINALNINKTFVHYLGRYVSNDTLLRVLISLGQSQPVVRTSPVI